jgi:hypothetical protein
VVDLEAWEQSEPGIEAMASALTDLASGTSTDRGLRFVVESMKGSGEFEVMAREEAFEQFMDAFHKVHKCLMVMHGELVVRKYAAQSLGEGHSQTDPQ